MNRALHLALLLASLLVCTQARAANAFAPCRPGAVVVYINGVNKTNEQVVAFSARRLAKNISHFSVSCVSAVGHFFNPSDGLFADLLGEVATQKATELQVSFTDALLQVGFAALGLTSTLGEQDQLRIRLRVANFVQAAALGNYTFTIDGVTYSTASLVAGMRDTALTELSQGTKVVLVAHSQGNFFANETSIAVRAAAAPSVAQGLGVVNVASPASIAPNGLWLTATQDLIILPLGSSALPANFNADGAYDFDLTGHGFDEVYQNRLLPSGATEASSIAARLMNLLQQALSSTPAPVGTIVGSNSFGLFAINLGTNTAGLLGGFVYVNTPTIAIWDIAINPSNGALFAISATGVYTIDRGTMAVTRLPQSSVGGNALAFNADGELYGMEGNTIFRFDTTTGAATVVPISIGSFRSSGDLTFDNEGMLYGTAFGSNGIDHLLRIDLNRSVVSDVGATGFSSVYGLYFSSGFLYGVSNNGTVVEIDRSTGAGVAVRSLPFGDVTGLQ